MLNTNSGDKMDGQPDSSFECSDDELVGNQGRKMANNPGA